jgi:hypothetical protein
MSSGVATSGGGPGTRRSVRQFGWSSARLLRKATQAHVLDQTFAQTASSRGQGFVLRRLLLGQRSRYSQCRSPAPLNPCASFELRLRHHPKHNPAKRVRSSAPMRPLSPVRVPWLASRMHTTISGDAAPSWSAHHDLADARSDGRRDVDRCGHTDAMVLGIWPGISPTQQAQPAPLP